LDLIVQIILVTTTAVTSFFVAKEIFNSPLLGWVGALFGIGVGYLIIKFEERLKSIPMNRIVGSLIGVIVSLVITNLFISKLLLELIKDVNISLPIYILIYVVVGYLGFRIGGNKSDTIDLSKLPLFQKMPEGDNIKILDTSTIIDGRIADIVETGFMEGTLIIPQFVLYEIQHIADTQDQVKRTRGRRGLDVLNRLQKQTNVPIKIVDYDFPRLKDVDSKLIALAAKLSGKILTNDYNLHKVAELQGIIVVNINLLATSLKPAILPGEQMNLKILKEGKEHRQGIGYLEDGTMVVVDDAKRLLGKSIDIIVTSVLQTTSGRMIFAKLKEQAEGEFYLPEEYKMEEETQ
jgi:uncharacterized protein YacL